MPDISRLSDKYTVSLLTPEDVDAVYALCSQNPLYYRYCPPFVTKESILNDMKALPPGTSYNDKFYIGFFKDDALIAVMDLILNFPNSETAFVGFFMMEKSEQGEGEGSRIVNECFNCLKIFGYKYVRLGFAKGNPQSEAFWRKNGFKPTGAQYDGEGYTVVVMERKL